MTIELHQFPTDWDLPNLSPFCMKIETWLRMVDLDYTVVAWDPRKAPNGKAPVVRLDGELIADSSIIIRRLSKHFDLDIDRSLTPEEVATGHLVARTLEEHLYWVELYTRWIDPDGWRIYKPILASAMPVPGPFAGLLQWWLRRALIKSAWAQGVSRHPPDEIYSRGIRDISAISTVLGDRAFLGGDEPCSYDAMLYAVLAHGLHPAWETPYRAHVRGDSRLVAYTDRMHARFWSEIPRPWAP